MNDAYICDGIRTPIGRYGGALSSLRPDDLSAVTLKALMARNPQLDWTLTDDIILGCANQAGKITATSREWQGYCLACRFQYLAPPSIACVALA